MTEKIGAWENLPLSSDTTTRQSKISRTGFKPANPVTTQNASTPPNGIRRGPLSPVRRPTLRQRDTEETNTSETRHEDHVEEFLTHLHIDPEDHKTLKALLGEASYTMIKNAVSVSGVRHADALHLMIVAAGGESTCNLLTDLVRAMPVSAGSLKNNSTPSEMKKTLSRLLPMQEISNGNVRTYTKQSLVNEGIPKDCIGVLVYTKTDPLAYRRLQHCASDQKFPGSDEGHDGLVFAVLSVDHENDKMLCRDFNTKYKMEDSHPDGNFFQVSISAFDHIIESRLIGGMLAIHKHNGAQLENIA
jgi:hypothetical protein